jgi:hypothetical protein
MPFSELRRDYMVMAAILKGTRPTRPMTPEAAESLHDPIWDVMQRCWIAEPQSRASLHEIAEVIGPYTARHESPNALRDAPHEQVVEDYDGAVMIDTLPQWASTTPSNPIVIAEQKEAHSRAPLLQGRVNATNPSAASMPPPPLIPERRKLSVSNVSDEGPPARPSSLPPPELIKRAMAPLLRVPTRSISVRHPGASMPANSNIRQWPSTSSSRPAAAAAQLAGGASPGNSALLSKVSLRNREHRELSTTSLVSGGSLGSPRSSVSSDHLLAPNSSQSDGTPGHPSVNNHQSVGATDPAVIHAITQTMIGEFLYKYTRRTIGKGHGEHRHKRFFWVHPYTKTLHWSMSDPGSANVTKVTSKSGKPITLLPSFSVTDQKCRVH